MFDDFKNKHFRDAFLEENIRLRLALQIRTLREKNNWSQPVLAEKSGKPQSVISRLEDPNYGKFTVRTLLDLASTFDVALFIGFVPYSKLIAEIKDVSPKGLTAASYTEEKTALLQSHAASEAAHKYADTNPPLQKRGRAAYEATSYTPTQTPARASGSMPGALLQAQRGQQDTRVSL